MMDPHLRQELRKLITSFVSTMGTLTEGMARTLEEGRAGGLEAPGAWESLAAAAHRISGSGASFGFADIAQTARRIDLRAQQALAVEGLAPWDDPEIAEALRELAGLVAVAEPRDSPLFPAE